VYYPQAAPVVVVQQQNDSSSAVLVECICGFFGLYGIGWLMSGYTTTGIILLAVGLFWSAIVLVLLIFSGFLLGLCLGPINIALWITSALVLNSHLKQRRMVVIR
jgi:TM2 domain-containing membrane protein YozV